jgi:hypothetical protein
MSTVRSQDFNELKESMKHVSDLSLTGFLMNVHNSLKDGKITQEEKELLLEKLFK